MIDFHTHIVYDIDDGSRTLGESLEILDKQEQCGVRNMIATPHFYPDTDFNAFIDKRSKVCSILNQSSGTIYQGAEVLLSTDTAELEYLEQLCIQGTRYILLELPYSHWSEWVYEGVQNIIDNRKLIPIIAHIERYETVGQDPNKVLKFIEMGALIQVNAYSVHPRSSRRKLVDKLIKHQMVHVLGSDVHRNKGMTPVASGYRWIQEQHGQDVVDRMNQIGDRILQNQTIELIQPKPFKKLLGMWI